MVSPQIQSVEDALSQGLGELKIYDNVQESTLSAADRKKKEWEENCKRYNEILHDWHDRTFDRSDLRTYYGQNPGPRCFGIGATIVSNVYRETVQDIPNVTALKQCDQGNYAESMKLLMEAEEVHQAVSMQKFNRRVSLEFNWADEEKRKLIFCRIHLPNLANWSPSLVPSDYVFLYDSGKIFAKVLQIRSIKDDYIYLPNDKIHQFSSAYLQKPLNVSFVSSGTPFRFCQMALRELQLQRGNLSDLVFDRSQPDDRVKIDLDATNTKSLLLGLNKLNDSQRNAVIGIIEAKCRPKPYILFGPPGTGKSHTLVAAVVQVYHRSAVRETFRRSGNFYLNDFLDESESDCYESDSERDIRAKHATILICVNSNNCTDDLYQKLIDQLPKANILRLSAGDNPPRDCEADIIVTTNIKSGCLFPRNSFDYVFVDEAGHANGAESLVPMCSLKSDGLLVLAGDPKQLGPVITCRKAAELGLETSLLERLFEFKLYQRDEVTKKYDQRYITMLQECYRCDKRILAPCNRLFYDSDLICINSTPRGLLKSLNFDGPIQATNRVHGKEEKPEWSTSWRNFAEADSCVDLIVRLYKMGIEPDQIGVTTPYKLQQKEIQKKLKISLNFNAGHLSKRFLHYKYVSKRWTEEQEKVLDSSDRTAKRNLYVSLKKTHYTKVGDNYVEFDPNSSEEPRQLYEKVAQNNDWRCKIDSIDAFQGNEKEIMIISTVRTEPNIRRLEFLNDARRFNVAVSRAKWLVIVIGSPYVLELGKNWPELMKDAKNEIDKWPMHVHDLEPFSQKPLFRKS